ncbi:winged helix-turn-helix transcriptional regulator [Cytobacillus oceanisediminis]|uniref:Winged helix-turn-helix transcriptional regulator n=1 Tax=Niallia alba TaxID=2729105 RepID=A0A7Y0K949_9BACI|nr:MULTISPECIES: metalloregulator ArsR/SmtB family transcription factor [Bacillaceae]MBQ6447547.1 winged helix-turn-helix transcriptional regulator [Bacillus sp. (in: firmicutes)]MBZ9536075.1 winged helix-turn-helix transcriptional regulator [Cytobacillus oceanisediminis]NMO78128.1 winged helix-turn-helix transcriptional regulator [Niallia alba]UTI41414.1 metalloregulator ArsR/SmtB family transcription factor [Niallia sp. RD1]
MSSEQLELDRAAIVLKLLGDKTRLSMVGMLMIHDCCVCEFVDVINMSQPAISQHLRKLKDAGVVKEQRKGQWVIYSLDQQNKYFSMVSDILKYIPNQEEKFIWLEKQGLRISCE